MAVAFKSGGPLNALSTKPLIICPIYCIKNAAIALKTVVPADSVFRELLTISPFCYVKKNRGYKKKGGGGAEGHSF